MKTITVTIRTDQRGPWNEYAAGILRTAAAEADAEVYDGECDRFLSRIGGTTGTVRVEEVEPASGIKGCTCANEDDGCKVKPHTQTLADLVMDSPAHDLQKPVYLLVKAVEDALASLDRRITALEAGKAADV